jgi:hypothetical protein
LTWTSEEEPTFLQQFTLPENTSQPFPDGYGEQFVNSNIDHVEIHDMPSLPREEIKDIDEVFGTARYSSHFFQEISQVRQEPPLPDFAVPPDFSIPAQGEPPMLSFGSQSSLTPGFSGAVCKRSGFSTKQALESVFSTEFTLSSQSDVKAATILDAINASLAMSQGARSLQKCSTKIVTLSGMLNPYMDHQLNSHAARV